MTLVQDREEVAKLLLAVMSEWKASARAEKKTKLDEAISRGDGLVVGVEVAVEGVAGGGGVEDNCDI
eukprot:759826-Hanusia_phi.AAC.2